MLSDIDIAISFLYHPYALSNPCSAGRYGKEILNPIPQGQQ